MACTRPLHGYAAPGGKISFKDETNSRGHRVPSIIVKCGQCLGCRMERKRGWAIRAVHEAQMHEETSFLTLTYDKEHLPKDHSVRVKDWQDFAKRVRKNKGPFRFFHCGEYGKENLRPHYHACMFGHDFHGDRTLHDQKGGHPLWISEELSGLWQNGFSTIGSLSFDSAAYVAGYCVKAKTGEGQKESLERVNFETGEVTIVKAEYATMSRNKGLGYTWYEKYKDEVYPDDYVVMKGQKFRPPAYYDSLLEKEDPTLWEKIQQRRQAFVATNEDYQKPSRLEAKEKVLTAKIQQYSSRTI